MNVLRDAPGLNGPPDEPDYSEAVAAELAGMSFADLRDRCATYRYLRNSRGRRPYGYRFGEWLRAQIAERLAATRDDNDDCDPESAHGRHWRTTE